MLGTTKAFSPALYTTVYIKVRLCHMYLETFLHHSDWSFCMFSVPMVDQPSKPENLSCVAVQEKTNISPNISCQWEAAGRSTDDVPIKYNLTILT